LYNGIITAVDGLFRHVLDLVSVFREQQVEVLTFLILDCRMGGAMVGRLGASTISSSSVRLRFWSFGWKVCPPSTLVGRMGSSSSAGSKALLTGGFAGLTGGRDAS
jgi:hypothetical protein